MHRVLSLFDISPIFPNVDSNSLSGSIPTELGALTSLTGLYICKYIEFVYLVYHVVPYAIQDVVFSHCLMSLQYYQM